MSKQAYRLGLDIGTNSIGWAVINLEPQNGEGQKGKRLVPTSIRDMGARIFSDGRNPKDGTSLAAGRREARSARRRRDRYIARRIKLINALIRFGLMPEDENERRQLAALNPYQLRAQAVKEALNPFFLGRALYHLNQRRGFKSNRKTSSKDEMKNIGPEIEGLRQALGFKTLGEYFWERCQSGLPVRARPLSKTQKENLAPDDCLYPDRSMLQEEFRKIRDIQSQAHAKKVKNEDWDELEEIIFFQRDLKLVMPGRCTIEPEQYRAPIALPSYQKFTISQNLHNLEIIYSENRRKKEKLSADQWHTLWNLLQKQKTLSFKSIQKKLKLEGIIEFNLESERRSELKGNVIACLLSKDEYFGVKWFDFSDEEQDEIVEQLIHIEEPEALIAKAQKEWDLSEASAHHLADLTPDDFPRGYGRYCKQVLQKVTEIMVHQGLPFHEATIEAGFHHSDINVEAQYDRLDYYGKWLTTAVVGNNPEVPKEEIVKHYGRIPNPTVHIGLGQLMHVVNALIERYGKPTQVVIEVARELKQSYEQKQEIRKLQKKNQDDNKRIDAELEKLSQVCNRDNRIRYKLWEELAADPNDRKCPFSLNNISPSQLFSNQVEIEHILPFSKTLDDSVNNKTVSFTEVNRYKGNRSPAEAFDNPGSKYDYGRIMERVGTLSPRKRWRFDPDAMEKFRNEEEFLARAINDTAYLSRLSKQYLQHIVPHKEIWVVPGRLTAFLRYRWGLDGVLGKSGMKNRDDHRHHAVDALVVGLTDRGMLQKISGANSVDGKKDVVTPTPWGEGQQEFRSTVKNAVDQIVVSHRPDHRIDGQLHKETAYGMIKSNAWEKEQGYNVVSRKPLTSLSANEIEAIRDPDLRRRLIEYTDGLTGKPLTDALSVFADRELERLKDINDLNEMKQKIRHVRILKKENPLVEVRHVQGDKEHIKAMAPGQNHHVSFWIIPAGKELHPNAIQVAIQDGPLVAAMGISMYEANCFSPEQLKPHPAAKLVLKLHKNDTLKLEHGGKDVIARVVTLSPRNRRAILVEVKEGGNLDERVRKGHLKKINLAFGQLKNTKVRRVFIDPIGRIRDGGPVL